MVKTRAGLPDLPVNVLIQATDIIGSFSGPETGLSVGLSNTLFSNYARDKGWGMGARVGAIPRAIGGRTIGLSHTDCVFPLNEENLSRWRRWMWHIRRDQAIWVLASILGMALPCMMSLEFIRNATVTGDRVAAMTAEGIALRYPSFGGLFWVLTLSCGFLVLAPGQVNVCDQIARRWTSISAGAASPRSWVSVCDQIARRWTDMIWTASPRIKRLGQGGVRYLYYGILLAYGIWGLFVLWLLPRSRSPRSAPCWATWRWGFLRCRRSP